MIPQLVERIRVGAALPIDQAREAVLSADPLDIVLHLEQVWAAYDPAAVGPLPIAPARRTLMLSGQLRLFSSPKRSRMGSSRAQAGVLENTRGGKIFKRIVREYRSGVALGIPSPTTLSWLDASSACLFGAANPFSGWLEHEPGECGWRNARGVPIGSFWARPGVWHGRQSSAGLRQGNCRNTGFVGLFEELCSKSGRRSRTLRTSQASIVPMTIRIFGLQRH